MSALSVKILNHSILKDALTTSPVTLVDVGARAGVHERWAMLGKNVRVIGFEPDPIECERLNHRAAVKSGALAMFVSTALAEHAGRRTLHLTNSPGCSSMLEPNQEFLRRFPDAKRYDIDHSIDVPVDTLDHVVHERGIAADFIKLDVQGAELEVLRGAMDALRCVFGIEIEVEFAELYRGQPLFWQVDQFLRDRGFALFDLKRCWWKRDQTRAAANHRGQLVFGDALYFKDPIVDAAYLDAGKSRKLQLLKAIAITVLYEKFDFGAELADFGASSNLLSAAERKTLHGMMIGSEHDWIPSMRGRYWLSRWLQRFSNRVAPRTWGASDILW